MLITSTVALSDQSRERWKDYSDKIKLLFDDEQQARQKIRDLKFKIEEELQQAGRGDELKIAGWREEIRSEEQRLRDINERYSLLNAPVIAPSFDLFTEEYGGGTGIRFQTRKLNLNEQGNAIWLRSGGEVNATMEIRHDCQECGGAINQIIVGIGGEDKAQACVWTGGQRSNGWQQVSFSLNVPASVATYKVRVRYAQAYNCSDALGWWKVDRPEGPTAGSDIGMIVVSARPAGG